MDQESNTFGNLLIQKGLQLAILPNYKCPWILCLLLQLRQKMPKLEFKGNFSRQKSESY